MLPKSRNNISICNVKNCNAKDVEIRTVKDDETGEIFYSLIDAIYILRECFDRDVARKYWSVTKSRIRKKPSIRRMAECHQFKVLAKDGKYRNTDFANLNQIVKIYEYMCYSKISMPGATTFHPVIGEETHLKEKEYVKETLERFSNSHRTEFVWEVGSDCYEYGDDYYSNSDDYYSNSDNYYSNGYTDKYSNASNSRGKEEAAEEFMALIDRMVAQRWK
ncbi:MAG: hypothetical protein KBS82_01520 [Oscillospiraceae bacterium]|nr:hypothetical protein [Candidatus Limimonas egerieequi]